MTKVSPNVRNPQSNVMLVLPNVTIKPPNVTKVQSHVMLVLYNIRMAPSNVRKKLKYN